MKLHIEIELGPDEIGLATELLNTLRCVHHVATSTMFNTNGASHSPLSCRDPEHQQGLLIRTLAAPAIYACSIASCAVLQRAGSPSPDEHASVAPSTRRVVRLTLSHLRCRTLTSHVQITQRPGPESRSSTQTLAYESVRPPGPGPPPARPNGAFAGPQPASIGMQHHPQQQHPPPPQQQQQQQAQPQVATPPAPPQQQVPRQVPVSVPQPPQPPQHAMQQLQSAASQQGAPAQPTQAGFEAIIYRVAPDDEQNAPVRASPQ